MIPNQLKTKLLETMHACMDLPAIQQFTIINKDVFAISYDDAVGQIGPIQGFPKYVDKLEQFDTVFYFIRLLCDEYSKNIRATELKEQFYRIYEDTSNGGMRIRGEFLDSIMLENNTLPFIGRHNIKVSLQQMLNSQQSRISLIKGSPRMGRSYLQHYLSEIAGKTRRYELVPIDLAAVHSEFAEAEESLWGSSDREITNIPFRLRAVLAQASSTLVVDNFDQAQVETFFKKVYLYMSTVYKIDDDMDTFMTNVNSDLLPPSIYAPPNVERIGRTVMQWLQNQS